MTSSHFDQSIDLVGQPFGNYVIIEKLGEGGMGAVFLAQHPQIGKKVALKVLLSEFSNNQDIVERFFQEAKAVNNIGHPNIIDIHDYGAFDHPTYGLLHYFIMEHVGGRTLKDILRREQALPVGRALPIAIQIADALGASHRARIIHRDLKPDNVILSERAGNPDFVKVLDFGIAKLASANNNMTKTGMLLGTPLYMSPEQCESFAGIDTRSDIYSLGVVLYEMLTGEVPFSADSYAGVLVQHMTKAPATLRSFNPRLSPAVDALVLRALAKKPSERFQTMEEFAQAMREVLQKLPHEQLASSATGTSSGIGFHQTTLGGSAAASARHTLGDMPRSKAGWWLGLSVVVAIGIGVFFVMGKDDEDSADNGPAKNALVAAPVAPTPTKTATQGGRPGCISACEQGLKRQCQSTCAMSADTVRKAWVDQFVEVCNKACAPYAGSSGGECRAQCDRIPSAFGTSGMLDAKLLYEMASTPTIMCGGQCSVSFKNDANDAGACVADCWKGFSSKMANVPMDETCQPNCEKYGVGSCDTQCDMIEASGR